MSGIGAIFFALGPWHNRYVNLLAFLGKTAYGIYLVHVFWYLSLDMIGTKLHLTRGIGWIGLLIVLTTVGSALSTLLRSQSRLTAWMIGMTARKRS